MEKIEVCPGCGKAISSVHFPSMLDLVEHDQHLEALGPSAGAKADRFREYDSDESSAPPRYSVSAMEERPPGETTIK